MRALPRLASCLVTVAAAMVSGSAASTALPIRGPSRQLAVVGFQEAGDPSRLIGADAHALTTVGVDGVNLTRNARSTDAVPRSGTADRRAARRHGLRAELLFGNWSSAVGDFSEPLAHRLLASGPRIRSVSHRLAGIVRTQHWDGISIDLESLQARDRAGLITFVDALRAALPSGATISICISAEQSDAGFRRNGYELSRIAPRVTRIEYMTYDQHGPWENTPGPIGALRWQRRSLAAVLKYVPADEVDLGVAGYGYGWFRHRNVQLSVHRAGALAGDRARWRPRIGEWTARLPHGGTLWWSDARSYALRAGLARRWQLHGLAVWDLGLAGRLR